MKVATNCFKIRLTSPTMLPYPNNCNHFNNAIEDKSTVYILFITVWWPLLMWMNLSHSKTTLTDPNLSSRKWFVWRSVCKSLYRRLISVLFFSTLFKFWWILVTVWYVTYLHTWWWWSIWNFNVNLYISLLFSFPLAYKLYSIN